MNKQIRWIFLSLFCVLEFAASYKSTNKKLLHDLDNVLDATLYKRISKILAGASVCLDDKAVQLVCPLWKAAGACKYRNWMRKYCAKTCDLCTPPAPPLPEVPKCAYDKFGCCWDNVTAAKGPVKEGIKFTQCDPCLDRQSRSFCIAWSDKCDSPVIGQGDVMRARCPGTCKVPCDYNLNMHKTKCQDDKAYKQACLQWFDEGKCKTDQAQMRLYCPFSCGYCQVNMFNK